MELNPKDAADLEALIALALVQYVPSEYADELDSLEYLRGRVAKALLAGGDVARAMQYLGDIQPSECEDIYLSEDIAAAYGQSRQFDLAVRWEDRTFQLAQEQPDTLEEGRFNHHKHVALCNLAKLAHDRGDEERMHRCLNVIQFAHHYFCNEGLGMIDQLAQCGAYAQLRVVLHHLPPLHITLSYSFAGTPVIETLLRHGLEVEFWALEGMIKRDLIGPSSHALLHCGISRAVDLGQIPMALRMVTLETPEQTTLMNGLCEALVRVGKESALEPLLMDEFNFHGLSLENRLIALATYASVAWKTDSARILEFALPFWNREGGLDPEMQSQVACIFAWLNHWDETFSLDHLRAIPNLKWKLLVRPAMVHGNQDLLDLIRALVEPQQQLRCYLVIEFERYRLGHQSDIGSGINNVLADWESYDKPWTWAMLEPLYDFAWRELRDVDAMASVMEFASRKSVIPEKLRRKYYAEALCKAGRLGEALPYIPGQGSTYQQIELITRCIKYFLKAKRGEFLWMDN